MRLWEGSLTGPPQTASLIVGFRMFCVSDARMPLYACLFLHETNFNQDFPGNQIISLFLHTQAVTNKFQHPEQIKTLLVITSFLVHIQLFYYEKVVDAHKNQV